MKNIRLTIEYDGTDYNGWQIQKEKGKSKKEKFRTIQGEIERAILKITGKKSNLYASGRTDSGVHAKAQVANFHSDANIPLKKLQSGINAVLPRDISVAKIEEADKAFHSRFSAKSKIYRYTILNRNSRSVFLKRYSWYIPYKLNLSLMKKEAKVLPGRHDFKSFAASGKEEKSSTRTIKTIAIKKYDDIITIDIEADGFLFNMVRNMVGTLIDVGRGRLSSGSIEKILNAKDRTKAGPTAPAQGLCLVEVKY